MNGEKKDLAAKLEAASAKIEMLEEEILRLRKRLSCTRVVASYDISNERKLDNIFKNLKF